MFFNAFIEYSGTRKGINEIILPVLVWIGHCDVKNVNIGFIVLVCVAYRGGGGVNRRGSDLLPILNGDIYKNIQTCGR